MKKKLPFIVAIVGLLFSTNLKAEIVLYCQSELATGFIKDGGVWKAGNFKQKRFTLKFENDYSILSGLEDGRPLVCEWAYNNRGEYNTAICASGYSNGINFIYNLKTRRFLFQSGSFAGYVSGYGEPDTDVLYAGECQKF